MYSFVNPVTYSPQQLCGKTGELNGLKRPFLYAYSLLPLCRTPQGEGLLAVVEHSVMMNVVTLHITKDHPSQITAFIRHGSKVRQHEIYTAHIKKIIHCIHLFPFMLVIVDIQNNCMHPCLCVCVCVWTVGADHNAEQGSTLTAHWDSRNSCQNIARLLFRLWVYYSCCI